MANAATTLNARTPREVSAARVLCHTQGILLTDVSASLSAQADRTVPVMPSVAMASVIVRHLTSEMTVNVSNGVHSTHHVQWIGLKWGTPLHGIGQMFISPFSQILAMSFSVGTTRNANWTTTTKLCASAPTATPDIRIPSEDVWVSLRATRQSISWCDTGSAEKNAVGG